MTMSDPIGDMLTRIRNGQSRKKASISVPASNMRGRVLEVLVGEGYIRGYNRTDLGDGKAEYLVELKYYQGQPVISKIARVSTPGRRVYSSVRDLPRVRDGLGISIVSTPKGVMSDADAREKNVGGEVLCTVF